MLEKRLKNFKKPPYARDDLWGKMIGKWGGGKKWFSKLIYTSDIVWRFYDKLWEHLC